MSDDVLQHYGTPRHSGRYPWGSGGDPEQRSKSFLGYVKQLQAEGMSEVEIAKGLGIKTSELRARKSLAKAEERAAASAEAYRLKEKGMSNVAIGERMGINESSVRALLDPVLQARSNITAATADMLRETVEKKGMVDVGAGVETTIGITRIKMDTALAALKAEGYKVVYVKVQQVGTGKYTSIRVLAPPETPYPEIYKNRDKIQLVTSRSTDGGRIFEPLPPLKSINSNRVLIRYKEEGGSSKDGVIELRRDVEDLSLGNTKYAQVRIGVDGTHYLKGMAIYSDNMPDGVDIIYNTKKPKGTPKEKVFKQMEDDPDNPFGTSIKANGRRGALNIVNEEGDWVEWSRNISSQVLSKQPTALAKRQLELAKNLKAEEFEELQKLTNPAVKKVLLKDFADGSDSAAVHLKAAALPRQSSYVILPVPGLKPTEIYAPKYNNGESVVLIRHPHGGTFEIPQLTVNNRNPAARSIMEQATDAVGIHPKVAEKLSGADFDGDTVIVIPNGHGLIKTSPSLKGLEHFDTITAYPPHHGMKTIDGGIYNAETQKVEYGSKKPRSNKGLEMGKVSNLITDMTIKGANPDEIARAVRHSMVVIDAEKHHLNYIQSAIDNNISALKAKYQGGERSGASTLISRASSEVRVPERKDYYKIDPKTGKKIYEPTGKSFIGKDGKVIFRQTKLKLMEKVDDAYELSSGTKMEEIYAEHANALKALANAARKEMVHTSNITYSPSANKQYATQVANLKVKLNDAYKNKPLERQAQLLANKIVSAKKDANPYMEADDLKKIKGQALTEARTRTGAKKPHIDITDDEWKAIQLGAITNNTLTQILLNTDVDALKSRALPRTKYKMTDAKISRARSMAQLGYTQAEIAGALGVSTSTLQEAIK